ncbi:unnamed protein product [Brassica napus]|uniref:(rape) hypothetical protein n=1 Tax=Brassica napus TaxID=3708 RepID=A0A816KWP8_BRANA|nr:unnamed protein product [Brassica napus]
MPLEYTPISQLNSSQKEWKIRVLRIWDFHSKHKPEVVLGIEAILVDEKLHPVVLTLHYQNFGKISVQNSRFSTKLFLNEDIDEISAFKKGMASADTLAPFTVSPMVPPTRNKKDVESFPLSCWKTIDQIASTMEFNREGEIPQELMDLEGRKFAWIIRVKGTEKNYKQPSFKVFKLTDKPEVIHKFQDNVTMEVTTHPDLAISSSTCSAMQVENTSSEANDNDLPSCSPMTPTTKRQRSHSIDDEGIEESSTKPKGTSKMAKAESGKKVGNLKKESTKAKH